MPETCSFITVLDKPCGRPAVWLFSAMRVGETQAPVEDLCDFHYKISALEASFGCEHTEFSADPIPEGSPS